MKIKECAGTLGVEYRGEFTIPIRLKLLKLNILDGVISSIWWVNIKLPSK